MVAADDLELATGDRIVAESDFTDHTTDGEWSDLVSTVDDDTETDDVAGEVVKSIRYRITSYGMDFDVDGLVRRLNQGSVFVPPFQREFVWSRKRASQFIESLLLGLPVPGVFLTQEPETEKMMVIDGQQRLKTLQFFYSGRFGTAEATKPRPFNLEGVDTEFQGKRYADLSEPEQYRLDNSRIHATIIRQNFPEDGNSGMFHIFHRLNSGGQQLTPQEIRRAICRGSLMDNVRELNNNPDWRAIFGPKSLRQKDQELVLRFWAMYLDGANYAAPMLGFLDNFADRNRNPNVEFLHEGRKAFADTMRAFNAALGNNAFRTESSRQLNAAVFDSMSVGLARRIQSGGVVESKALIKAHSGLLRDNEYIESVSGGTARAASVKTRIQKAIQTFEGL